MLRHIVKIDKSLCNGCGACAIPCAEGAIKIVKGKAVVVKEELCDGAGFCLGACPTGALSIEERDAPAFDEGKVAKSKRYISQKCFNCGAGEEARVLMPVRKNGESLWVCTKCLPSLIHG